MSKGDRIKEMLREGKKYGEITRETGAAASTIAYHAKREGLRQRTFERQTYDWVKIQSFYDEGYTIKEVTEEFGLNPSSLRDAETRGDFTKNTLCSDRKLKVQQKRLDLIKLGKTRGKILKSSQVLIEHSVHQTGIAKQCVLREQLLPYSCVGDCPLHGIINPLWAGKPIVLHLDHIDGVRNNHLIGNLRFLCPNCHSQTETYCGKNKG